MAAEDFFNRWSRRHAPLENAAAIPLEPAGEIELQPAPALPCMEDVAQLHENSDFSLYMKQGVDESVKRSAMKKLFSQPHFNLMDGLDIYISDYSQADPLPPGMLATLRHAKSLLDPLQHLENFLQTSPEPASESQHKVATPESGEILLEAQVPGALKKLSTLPEQDGRIQADAMQINVTPDKDQT